MNKLMRMLVLFDLPVTTKAERAAASRFRKFLQFDGYHMLQFSVYVRICGGYDSVEAHRARLRAALPPKGAIRMLVITEKQYESIEVLLGAREVQDEPEEMEQLMLF